MNNEIKEAPPARLVNLPCNGAWQPVFPEFQYGTNRGEFRCYPSRFVVVTDTFGSYGRIGEPVVHHGKWFDRDDARKYAASCQNGGIHNGEPHGTHARVEEVDLYWYAHAFGMVDANETHES